MRLRTRIAATALTATLLLGAGATAATAASTYSAAGFPTLASCQYSERVYTAHFIRKGHRIIGGDVCGWRGSAKKYGFAITYR